jgi:hypothetical protein
MALTTRRWGILFVLGGATLVVAAWPAPRTGSRSREPTPAILSRQIIDRADRNLTLASRALIALQQRDAVLRGAPTHGPSISFQGRLPLAAQQALSEAFDSVLTELRPLAAEVAVRVVVIADSTRRGVNDPSGVWYFTPMATDGHTCLVLRYVDVFGFASAAAAGKQSQAESEERMRQLVGVCSFYAAFGLPGPRIEQWLREHNFLSAQESNWERGRPPIDEVPVEFIRDTTGRMTLSIGDLLGALSEGLRGPTDRSTIRQRACAHGDLARCTEMVFHPERMLTTPPLGPAYSVAATGDWQPNWLEPRWFLADVVRWGGRERFARFWRSPLPLDSAFAAGIGMPLDRWTAGWLRNRYSRTRFGPGVPLGTWLLGVGIAGLAALVALVLAGRRQVA